MPEYKKIIICSAAGDDPKARIGKMLLETKFDVIIKGIKQKMKDSRADEAYIYIPEGTGVKEKCSFISGDEISVITGEDSPVCRDRTALLSAMEGNHIRPFYVEDGKPLYFGNKEVADIISVEEAVNYGEGEGEKKYLFICGTTAKEGFIRASCGDTLAGIIQMAGGIKEGSNIKGVLAGGDLGEFFLPEEFSGVVLDKGKNAFSGVIEILDTHSCIAALTKELLFNNRTNSCGKCPLCREGTYQLYAYYNDIVSGKGKAADISFISGMAKTIGIGAFCQFGRNMAGLVLSSLRAFGEEIEDHIKRKKCPASKCPAFLVLAILPDKCTGCGDCLEVCEDDAIEGKGGYIHMIDEHECVKCGKCLEVCKEKAIITVKGARPRLPKRLVKVGQFT